MSKFSRRQFIITASAATATSLFIHGCSSGSSTSKSDSKGSSSSSTGPAANAPKVETTQAKLGFIALTDSAPLIIAKEKGIFEKYGMKDVQLEKQKSWPVTRDNIKLGSASGGIDGAHILSPMPYLITLNDKVPMYLLARLNTNGQAISVANTYKDMKVGLDSKGLKQAVARGRGGVREGPGRGGDGRSARRRGRRGRGARGRLKRRPGMVSWFLEILVDAGPD